MYSYEVVLIGRQDLSQQQMEALGVNLGLFVTQNNGEVVRSEYCGLRNLAYAIKKNRKGHYYVIQARVTAAVVAELDRIMKLNEDIIRHLVVKVDKFDERDVLISQAKSFSDDFSFQPRDDGYRSQRQKSGGGDFVADDLVESKDVTAG
jgi:small subunit ribosomal protein S6